MDKQDQMDRIASLKKELGDKITIPTHHYQNIDIVGFADFIGDSYKLAVECSKSDAEFIVFCGVLFMAEGASILSKPEQKILIPDTYAGCPMADMADLPFVKKAYNIISKECAKEIAPIVYMNSYSDLKSFCGKKGGSVCTSSNAPKILDHYLKQDKAILFFPDYYLGKNRAKSMKIDNKHIVKIKKDLSLESTGNIKEAKIFLWDGFCPIHQRFTVGDIKYLRKKYINIKIIVHPECTEDVVDSSDISGSTERIHKEIHDSPPGSVWGVGTETTFVQRLAIENPDKIIKPLRDSVCQNMLKITPEKLLSSLESVAGYLEGKSELKYEIQVKNDLKDKAKKALEKMIDIVQQ